MAGVPPALAQALRNRYLIERELGHGGMATVYLARDLKHDRPVALKVLRPDLTAILGTERFLREIRVTAGLQHPHILPLLDSGEAGNLLFYVMPYVDGESLRQRLVQEGQLPVDEVVHIASGVALALDFAHGKGVIHRDIKPENILLYQGEAIVADFGIAMALSTAGRERLTETGLSLGTPAYMSPEQVTADPKLDGRSDQYSLGCVVYEMLAGEPPYTGPTAQAIIAKRLVEPVPHLSTVRTVAPEIETAVSRALCRSPADRFRTTGAFVKALSQPSSATIRPGVRGTRRTVMLVFAATAFVAVAALTLARRQAPQSSALHRQLTFTGSASEPSISPDGQWVAYVAGDTALMVQEISGSKPVSAVKLHRLCCTEPKWSPDGRSLLFTGQLDSSSQFALYTVPRLGGTPRRVAAEPTIDFGYRPDGRAVVQSQFMTDSISITDLATGDVLGRFSVTPTSYMAWRVGFSPNGRWIAFGGESTVPFLGVVSPEGSTVRRLVDWVDRGAVRWSPRGDAIYFLQRVPGGADLMKVRVEPRSGERVGTPVRVMSHAPFTEFDVGPDGKTLVYQRETPNRHIWATTFDGPARRIRVHAKQLTSGTNTHGNPALSPDGKWVAFARDEDRERNIYITPFAKDSLRLVGTTRSDRYSPAWSSDGRRLAFASADSATPGIMIADLSGDRPVRVGASPIRSILGTIAWSPDGKMLLYAPENPRRYLLVDLASNRETVLVPPDSAGWLYAPLFSPNGAELVVVRSDGKVRGTLWRVELAKGQWTQFKGMAGFVRPVLWSEDGWIYVLSGRDIRRLRPDGGAAEYYATLPIECGFSDLPSMSRDARRLVCTVVQTNPDIWMATNFDPEVR
ncbi:MAG: protein kinase domain-containing protein [Acidimicrobiia bacterium]